MKIKDVHFKSFNSWDTMCLIVDEYPRDEDAIFHEQKRVNQNEEFFVTIYPEGFASFGLRKFKDPYHGNKEYIWSSRPAVINDVFNLYGKFELARHTVSIRTSEDYCCIGYGILKSLAFKLAKENEDSLTFGYEAFVEENTVTPNDPNN